MTIFRWILSFAVLLFAMHIVVMNWAAVIVSFRNKRRGIDKYHSTVPGLSLFLTIIVLFTCPRPDLSVWTIAVPLLDIAHWIVLLSPVFLIRELMRRKSG